MAIRCIKPTLARLDARIARPLPKETLPFYRSPEWRSFMAGIIAVRGRRCEEPGCGAKGCRIYGDHIHELKDGGAPFDEQNIMLRCGACHNRKTAAERQRRAVEAKRG